MHIIIFRKSADTSTIMSESRQNSEDSIMN
jgi:hypothetical protein